MKKGTFIVIEGGEGCGKSTLLEYLREEALKVLWREEKVAFTREPGGSPFAEEIRLLMLGSLSKQANGLTQFGLAWASRADHIKNLIRPHLENGIHVISDRFDSSTYAYQVHGQETPGLKDLFFSTRKVYLEDIMPDSYIFLDVDPKIGAERVSQRAGVPNHFDERKLDFHQRVRAGYMEFFEHVSHTVIDANQSLEKVKRELKLKINSLIRS